MTRLLFCICSAVLVSATAQASTYYFTDVGIRSFSRGGAFIAGTDDT